MRVMLLDRILANGIDIEHPVSGIDEFLREMEGATVFQINNVARFYESSCSQDHKTWQIGDFPNLAPPLPKMFFEFNHAWPLPVGTSAGVFITAIDTSRKGNWIGDVGQPLHLPDGRDIDPDDIDPEEIRWVLSEFVCVEYRGRISGVMFNQCYLRPDGAPVFGSKSVGASLIAPFADHAADDLSMAGRFLLYPTYLAISLMHCKNVTIAANDPPRKLQDARVKAGHLPLTRYHVLNIDPMKTVLRREGQQETEGLKKALHICRGHFADYTDGPGLFGKYHGIYWVDQHVRGKAERGIVTKDYSVMRQRG